MKNSSPILIATFTVIIFAPIIGMELSPPPAKLLPSKQAPSVASQTYLDKLSPDLQCELLNYIKFGRDDFDINIPKLAQATMAMGKIQGPSLLSVLKAMPTKAASLNLVEKLAAMPAIKDEQVQEWVKSIKLQNGQRLFAQVTAINPNKDAVATLLADKNIDLNWKNEHGMTPLSNLINNIDRGRFHPTAIIFLLLWAGADVDVKDNWGNTALKSASYHGDNEAVKLLLSAGARVNIQDNDGDTSLMDASRNNNPETIRILFDAGGHVNHKNGKGATALMLASHNGNTEAAMLLHSLGADATCKDNKGRLALDYARTSGQYSDIAKFIEKITEQATKEIEKN